MKSLNPSEHFTYKKLLRFTLPAIIMMIFHLDLQRGRRCLCFKLCRENSIFAAINLIYPVMMILGAVGADVWRRQRLVAKNPRRRGT